MTPRWEDVESLRSFVTRIGPFDIWLGPFNPVCNRVALVWGENNFVYSDSIEDLRNRYDLKTRLAFHDAEFEAVCAALLLLGVAARERDVGMDE